MERISSSDTHEGSDLVACYSLNHGAGLLDSLRHFDPFRASKTESTRPAQALRPAFLQALG